MFDFLIIVGVIIAGWLLFKGKGDNTSPQTEHAPAQDEDATHPHLHHMQAIMQRCQAEHPNATKALSWMAGSDGTISRQELRTIINFCINQGMAASKAEIDSIESLNNGINMQVVGSIDTTLADIRAINEKPLPYRAAFVGAAEAIANSNRTINASKRKALEAARTLIQ